MNLKAPNSAFSSPLAHVRLPGIPGRPGDDYNARGDVRGALARHGWRLLRTVGENEHWRRPGKESGSLSATLRKIDGVELFFVFSANASPFEPGRAYPPFSVTALLGHGGDFAKAAAELRRLGYGAGAGAATSPGEAPEPADSEDAESKPATNVHQGAVVALLVLAQQRKISTTDVAIGLSLCSFMDKSGKCFPSRQAIGERANVRKLDTVSESVNRLAAVGFIRIQRRQRMASIYTFETPRKGVSKKR